MGRGKGKHKGLAADDEEKDGEAPVVDGEVGMDGWRRAYRKHTPEKAPPAWKCLAQGYRYQRRACVSFTPRRQSIAMRRDGNLKSLAAGKVRRRHARRMAVARRRAIQAGQGVDNSNPEDSDSDSSNGQGFTEAGSSSSSSDSE